MSPLRAPRSCGACSRCAQRGLVYTGASSSRERLSISRTRRQTRIIANHSARPSNLRSAIGVPMVRDGRVIGAVAVGRIEVRPFTEKETALLQTFAHQAVIAIENVRLFKETSGAQRGTAGGPGASDGNGRGARHHQPLAHGRSAGPRRHRRECRPGLRD